jgi:photosystem II stability/assembly factor-like uncharacterized protein
MPVSFGRHICSIPHPRYSRSRKASKNTRNLALSLLFVWVFATLSGCTGSSGTDQGAPPVKAQIGWVTGTAVDGYGVILHTTDGGNTWVRQGSPTEIPDYDVGDIRAMDALNAWAVAGSGTGGVILRTRDGGLTWVQQKVTTFGLTGIGVVDGNTAWVVGSSGTILLTSDGGSTWTTQQSGTNATLFVVAVLDAMNAWIIGDQDSGYAVILRTTDGGATWSRQGTADTIKTTGFIDVSAVDSSTAWAVGTQTTVLHTVDGGATWTYQLYREGYASPHVNGVCAFDTQHVWFAEDDDTIGSTTDGGATWIQQASPSHGFYLISVSVLDLNTIWIVGAAWEPITQPGVILHTTDGGTTWTEQTSPVNSRLRRVSFVGARK